ncbi:hypothetical protein Ahy_A05g024584 isoform B [Arachis hypogaea]|uniref:Uncharacterized protein n=1 Tax=Arachis hypogaea TaxID=3818 RepID=A0A445D625_ARAHY|nr:hypothetical protein Ahy_A05g024584 isoform B [Arachis hypogaea]
MFFYACTVRSEIGTQELDEFLRENNKKSAAQWHVLLGFMVFSVNNMYSIMFRIPDVNLGSDDHSSQEHTEQSSVNKPVESMLNLFEENMMVVREETQSEGLAIVPIQVCLPLS